MESDDDTRLENGGINEEESLIASPSRRKAPPALFKTNDGNAKEFIDLSAVALKEAQGASNKVLADLMQAKPRPGDVKAWIRSLDTNETERAILERSLISFGSIENLANDQKHLDRENKKLRFREQRFAHQPLLRRRRLDMLPPQLLKVMVVSLQNELASANEIIEKCRVAEHPLIQDKLPPTKKILMQDLQRILASGVGETTPFRSSVSNLSDRQRDLMTDSLRNQNRLLRSQIMRLQACLNGLPGAEKTVMAGPEGSPRIANYDNGEMSPTRGVNNNNIGSPLQGTMLSPQHNGSPSPKQHRFRLMEERIQQSNAEITRLQKELFKTQEDLRRSESTIDAQLEIEAKMIEEKARLSRQNLQLGTFTLRVLEDSHPKLAAQVLRGRSLRGWYKAMLDGEDFDADAWAIEREGIAGSDEPEEQVYRNRRSSKSENKNDSDDVDEGKSSRPSTSQTDRTDDSEVDTRLRNNKKKKKQPILTPGSKKPARPQSSSKYKHSRSRAEKDSRKGKSPRGNNSSSSRSKKRSSKKRSDALKRGSNKKDGGMFKLPLKDLTLGTRRGSTSQSPSVSARSDKALTKPIFNVDDVPASARLLRLSTGPDEEETSVAVVENEKSKDVLPKDVAEAISPIVVRFDRVLRQVFTHFARTQNKPIGSRDLFAEIARWTSTLTHASFFKVLKHFKVVPVLCTKKDAFTLLIGTNRSISYAEFLARLVDISNLCMKRLYVLADANSIQYLEKCFLLICRKVGLLKRFEGGRPKGKDEDEDEDEEDEGEKYNDKSIVLLTKPPPSVMLNVNAFIKYATEEDKILESLFPGDSINLLNTGEEDRRMSWSDMKSYWWKNCSNSRTPGIIKKRDDDDYDNDMPPEFSNPTTSPPRVVSGLRRRQQLAKIRNGGAALANPENQAKAFELLCNFMVQTEVNITE